MIDLELIALLGAVASVAVLAIAPVMAVYAVAFVALTPILGAALWLLLGGFRGARAPTLSQRRLMRALERGPQAYITNGLAKLIFATIGVVKPHRLGQAPRSATEDAAVKQATQSDGTAQP